MVNITVRLIFGSYLFERLYGKVSIDPMGSSFKFRLPATCSMEDEAGYGAGVQPLLTLAMLLMAELAFLAQPCNTRPCLDGIVATVACSHRAR